MFGSHKQDAHADSLTVQVHVVASADTFQMAQKIWGENSRLLHTDATTGKEYLHFAYASPKCTVWLQRDQGRADAYELVVRWDDENQHEVYVLTSSAAPVGNAQRVQELLHSILTVPSIVPSNQASNT